MSNITGLVAASFTPFTEAGELNLDAVAPQAKLLAKNGVGGVFVCGSTGEWSSMTTEERKALSLQWRNVRPKGQRLIIHVGHCCLKDAQALAEHAQQIGADAIGALAPCFFRPATVKDLADFCAELAAAAPKLPFYYYHIPVRTGVNFPMVDFLRAGAERIPTLAGIKFTNENLMDYANCLQLDRGRFNMLYGCDELLLPALAAGAEGAVGTTYCYFSIAYLRVIRAFRAGDLAKARLWHGRAREMIGVLFRYGGLPAAKVMMSLAGVECGPVRKPLTSLTPQASRAMRQELKDRGLLKWFSRA